ncbi:26S proteasome complex subunit SEM1-like [Talpa occidentalis]|uniref:26S proteasome complex subunit SEM1-like n=1 Tax=Talpa occidentalis TaxID=50954 RepID=UPI0023F6DBB7|nr:26S proteasome complex subunit SEM1-like [Talpa occidentalis]
MLQIGNTFFYLTLDDSGYVETCFRFVISERKELVDLGFLKEDDQFKDFPADDWAGLDENEDAPVWGDNWDDDRVENNFSNQL